MIEQKRIRKGLDLTNGQTIIEGGLNIGEKVLISNLQKAAHLKGIPVQPIIDKKAKKGE